MAETTIGWTATRLPSGEMMPGFTFNPWRGCVEVHAGCTNCYARELSKRNPKVLGEWGKLGTRVVAAESYWKLPAKWNRAAQQCGVRAKVFCASLSDVFEDWEGPMHSTNGGELLMCDRCNTIQTAYGEPCGCGEWQSLRLCTMDAVRRRLFATIDATPHLDWLILTKRPSNAWKMWHLGGIPYPEPVDQSPEETTQEFARRLIRTQLRRPNVWIGTSISERQHPDEILPKLRECRDLTPVLFVSAEPLLEPIDLSSVLAIERDRDGSWRRKSKFGAEPLVDWVIVGGESGRNRRPCEVAWIAEIELQCRAANVPCFVKQDCALQPGKQGRIPDSLWNVKEFPRAEKTQAPATEIQPAQVPGVRHEQNRLPFDRGE